MLGFPARKVAATARPAPARASWRRRLMAGLLAMALMMPAVARAAACTAPKGAAEMTAAVVAAVNAERRKRGLAELSPSAPLAAAAGRHACDITASGAFSHRGPRGSTPKSRARDHGYRACTIAENIAMGYDSAAAVAGGWMGSEGHRRNILTRGLRDIGVGVAAPGQGDGGGLRWVLVLAAPC